MRDDRCFNGVGALIKIRGDSLLARDDRRFNGVGALIKILRDNVGALIKILGDNGVGALIKTRGGFPLARDGRRFNWVGALIKTLGDSPLARDNRPRRGERRLVRIGASAMIEHAAKDVGVGSAMLDTRVGGGGGGSNRHGAKWLERCRKGWRGWGCNDALLRGGRSANLCFYVRHT